MKTNPHTDWRIIYSAAWRPLSQNQADSWVVFLADNLKPEPSQSDINGAVAALADSWRGQSAPCVRDVLYRILERRRVGADTIGGRVCEIHDRGQRRKVAFDGLVRDLELAEPDDRWTICCQPVDVHDCQELFERAKKMHGGVERYIPNLRSQVSKVANAYDAVF